MGAMVDSSHFGAAFHHIRTIVDIGMAALGGDLKPLIASFSNVDNVIGLPEIAVGEPIVELLMRGGLGVNPDYAQKPIEWGPTGGNWTQSPHADGIFSDSHQGIDTLKRLIGFGLLLPYVFGGLEFVLKLVGAQRIGNALHDNFGKLSESVGINYATGMIVASIFETAAGKQIEELVNIQLHPNRLDMQVLRMLARQHKISGEQFDAGLELLGYPADLRALILKLDTQQLALTDLQSLWIRGVLDREQIQTYLEGMGFSDHDTGLLLQVYVDHAETQGMGMYRNLIRTAHQESRLTDNQFQDMEAQLLLNPQVPPTVPLSGESVYDGAPDQVKMVIDLELGAQRFAREFGRSQQTIATVKKLAQSSHITRHETEARLMDQGYNLADAQELINSWDIGPQVGKPQLTTAKILAYEKSGVFDQRTAQQKLINLGVSFDDAEFLSLNPDAKAGPYYPPFSIDTILQAYYDDAATEAEVMSSLLKLPMDQAAATEQLAIAHARKVNKLILSPAMDATFRAEIEVLFMGRSIGEAEAIDLLERTGLMQADAGYYVNAWHLARDGTPMVPPTA